MNKPQTNVNKDRIKKLKFLLSNDPNIRQINKIHAREKEDVTFFIDKCLEESNGPNFDMEVMRDFLKIAKSCFR